MSIENSLERIATALEALAGRSSVQQPVAPASVSSSPPSAALPMQAPPAAPRGRGRPKAATASAPPGTPETQATPALAPASTAAPAVPGVSGSPSTAVPDPDYAAKQAALAQSLGDLQKRTTESILALANDFSRDEAVAILKSRRGSSRCSELLPSELQGVYEDATAAYERHKALAAVQNQAPTQSLL